MENFVTREGIDIGKKLVLVKPVQIVATKAELVLTHGHGGLKDEPVLLIVASFSKREFTAHDRYSNAYYFSQKTGRRCGYDTSARVATEAEIVEIEAIIDYNREVTVVRALLDRGRGPHWDAVLGLFSNLSQCYDCDPSEVPF